MTQGIVTRLGQSGGGFLCQGSFKMTVTGIVLVPQIIKSPPTMWWWRLIVFAESARSRRILFLLSLENPCSDYFQIFAVCIQALENLSGIFFFLRFPVS